MTEMDILVASIATDLDSFFTERQILEEVYATRLGRESDGRGIHAGYQALGLALVDTGRSAYDDDERHPGQ